MYVRIMCSSNRIDQPSIIGRGRNQPEKINYEKPIILVALEEMAVYREGDGCPFSETPRPLGASY
jgi:hypothetical protein